MRNKRRKSKYEEEAVIARATVNRVEVVNQLVNDKYKNVFYCPSYLEPNGRMCIYWGRVMLNIGDEIEMKGRFSDGAFLVWSLKRTRSGG